MTSVIDKPLTRLRTAPTRGGHPKVDRAGGDYGAGLIRDVSVTTLGEALGHRAWIDQFAVEQVVQFGKKSRNGIKVRFTHPSLSADGMGTLLGREKNFRVSGHQALADIHFEESAHKTPDGDLASYVMDMAEEDPEAFGTSIVFDHDYGEEDRFVADHEDEDGYFRSPDDANTNNYPHIRLAKLWADDVVDDPAANPGGLFRQGQELADEADKLCEFVLGLNKEKPVLRHLSADADRIAQFAARFMESHQLELRKKEMTTTNKDSQSPAGLTQELLDATLEKFGASLTTGILGKVDEKLAAFKPKEKTGEETPTAEELEKRGAKRASDLYALAKTAGLSDGDKLAQEWVEKGLSVEAAKASLADRLIAQNTLSKDGGTGEQDQYSKFRKEYRDHADIFRRNQVTEDSYIRTRCRDEGLPVPEIKKAS